VVSFLALVCYIPFDYIRSCAITYRSDIIAIAPEFSAPQPLFHFGKLPKYLPAGNAFQNIHNLRGRKSWWSGNENMNMIAVRTQRNYFKTVFFSNFPNYFTDTITDFYICQNIMSIFYNPNKMIFYYIPHMGGYGIFWHMPRLYHNSLTRVGEYPPTTPLKCSPPQGDGVND